MNLSDSSYLKYRKNCIILLEIQVNLRQLCEQNNANFNVEVAQNEVFF